MYVEVNVIIQSDISLCNVTFVCKFLWTEMQEREVEESSGGVDSGPMNSEESTGTSL